MREWVGGMPSHHAQWGLTDKCRAIKGLLIWYSWDLMTLDLLNGLALGCYRQSLEKSTNLLGSYWKPVWLFYMLAILFEYKEKSELAD